MPSTQVREILPFLAQVLRIRSSILGMTVKECSAGGHSAVMFEACVRRYATFELPSTIGRIDTLDVCRPLMPFHLLEAVSEFDLNTSDLL